MLTTKEMRKAYQGKLEYQSMMQNGDLDNIPIDEMVTYARFIGNSQVYSRWYEKVIANLLDWDRNPTKPDDGQDYGDLMVKNGIIGEDNCELKTTTRYEAHYIGGGQCRFYEDIPWYIFLSSDPEEDTANFYILSKDDIYKEAFEFDTGVGSISQGSGKTKHSDGTKFSREEKKQLLKETFEQKNDHLWGFGIDCTSKNQLDNYKRWTKLYKVDIESLKGEDGWKRFKKSRGV